ncbi:MAG: SpoIIE family protein phosphatase [Bacteroidales bacterium]
MDAKSKILIRRLKDNPILIHTTIGIVAGYFLLHPITMVIYWFEISNTRVTFNGILEAFIERFMHAFYVHMMPMSLVFIVIGGLSGLGSGLYFRKIRNQKEELRILNEKKDHYLSIISSDLETASDYIESLLPEEIYTNDLQINWKIVPSAQLGGDSFGYHWIDNDHLAIYILDVAGHGVSAALLSVSVLNTLKFQSLVNINFRYPDQVLEGLNNVFQMTDHYSMFITMWYCVYCRSKQEIRCGGAGHPPFLIFKPDGKLYRIPSQNTMVGAEADYRFHYETIQIMENSILYLYTDGVFEIKLPNGMWLEIEDLENFLSENLKKHTDELDVLYNHIVDLNAGNTLDDDFTIIKIHLR